jgi:hypothetical protein
MAARTAGTKSVPRSTISKLFSMYRLASLAKNSFTLADNSRAQITMSLPVLLREALYS